MTSAEDGPRDDLVRFVRETRAQLGLSYRELAERAIDPATGHQLGFQWLAKLEAHGVAKAPDPWQLRALAAALGVPDEMTKDLAARQWLEYEVATLRLGDRDFALYVQLRDLAEEDKETLRLLVHRFVQRQEERERGQQADEPPA
jgi:transcriptional regulator with XRE-family HTH domain